MGEVDMRKRPLTGVKRMQQTASNPNLRKKRMNSLFQLREASPINKPEKKRLFSGRGQLPQQKLKRPKSSLPTFMRGRLIRQMAIKNCQERAASTASLHDITDDFREANFEFP
jgi:hypothetical protein